MKKYFVLFLMVVLSIGFVACGEERTGLSFVSVPVIISPFESGSTFLAKKDSERISEGMGRVIIERQEKEGKNYALFCAFVIPYKDISAGTRVEPKKVSYYANGSGEFHFFTIID